MHFVLQLYASIEVHSERTMLGNMEELDSELVSRDQLLGICVKS